MVFIREFRNLFGCVALFAMLFACTNNKQLGVYVWQQNPDLDSAALNIGGKPLDVLYVHMFDIVWSEFHKMGVPVSDFGNFTDFQTRDKMNRELGRTTEMIPVVFIDNKVFYNEQNLEEMAELTHRRIERMVNTIGGEVGVKALKRQTFGIEQDQPNANENNQKYWEYITEYQIDCDWTEKTRERYFEFLKILQKKITGKRQSVTIRLYPYKYFEKTGVPPADKGVLMCYNLANVTDTGTVNSIFNIRSLISYVEKSKPYPLELDLALPVFSWVACFRNKRFFHLIRDKGILNDGWVKNTGRGRFVSNADTVIGNVYFRLGDEFRLEQPDSSEILKSVRILKKHVKSQTRRLIFFHASKENLIQHKNVIKSCYEEF